MIFCETRISRYSTHVFSSTVKKPGIGHAWKWKKSKSTFQILNPSHPSKRSAMKMGGAVCCIRQGGLGALLFATAQQDFVWTQLNVYMLWNIGCQYLLYLSSPLAIYCTQLPCNPFALSSIMQLLVANTELALKDIELVTKRCRGWLGRRSCQEIVCWCIIGGCYTYVNAIHNWIH